MTTLTLSKPTRSSRFLEFIVVLVAGMGGSMVTIDTTAVNVALPTIQVVFATDIGGIQWLIDIFILILATLLLIGGVLGDRYGRVKIVVIGASIFTTGSLLAGMAPTFEILLVARAIQGIGGALLTPAGLALINTTVPPERRGKMIGLWGMLTTAMIATGPLLGGWLVDQVSWRGVFLINVPVGIITCILALRYIPESRNGNTTDPLDWPGVITLIVGLGGLLFGLIEGPHWGWQHPIIISVLIASLFGFIAFIFVEKRSPNPVLPLHLFKITSFSGISLLTIIYFMAFGGFLIFFALNLQQIQGYSALESGLAVVPITLMVFALSTPMGVLTDRYGARPLLLIGLVISTISFVMYARLGIEANYWTSFFPATIMLGFGLGIIVVPMTIVVLASLPDHYSGIASASSYAATRIGNMLAIALFGMLMVIVFRGSLAEQIAVLPLEPETQQALLAEARNLGTTTAPDGLDARLTQTINQAIQFAFIESFQQVMYLCVGLMILGIGITWFSIRTSKTPA